jgi:hypothetical protein
MKDQSQKRFRTLTKGILILFTVAGFFCSLFPSSNALTDIRQQNPAQLLLPSQNYHLIFIVVDKMKQQESIPSNKTILLDEPSGYHRHIHFAALMIFAVETVPSYISNLLFTQTTSSCL